MTVTVSRQVRRDAARNRLRLIDAARRVFAAGGLDAGVEEVARTAGVGMGTLYRHFPTKDALVGALVEDTLSGMRSVAEEALAEPDGMGLELFLAWAMSLQAANRGCLPRLWKVSPDHPDMVAVRRLVARLLADAKRAGRVRSEVTETDLTLVLWSVRGVIEAAGDVVPDAWRRHLGLMVAALRPGPGRLDHQPLTRAQMRQIVAPDSP